MMTFIGPEVHVDLGNLLLIFDRAIFDDARKRGKAYKRAEAQRAREARHAAAAERKRDQRTTGRTSP